MPTNLQRLSEARQRVLALPVDAQDLVARVLYRKLIKPRLGELSPKDEESSERSFINSYLGRGGGQLPRGFGRPEAPREGFTGKAADVGTIAVMPAIIKMSEGLEAFHKFMDPGRAEEHAAYFQAGRREMKKDFAQATGKATGFPRQAYEFITGEVARLAPTMLAGAGISGALAPIAATGRVGAAAVGATEGALGFGAYTGDPEDMATGALIGGGLSTALPLIPKALGGIRSKVRQLRGKPPVPPKTAPATELEQALAGEKTKSAILDEISVKRTGKAFAELTEQESSKFGPRIMGEYNAAVKAKTGKTGMSARDRKELSEAVGKGQADIEAIRGGSASAKAVQRRMSHARELKGSKLTELEEMNIRSGMSPLDAISGAPATAVPSAAVAPAAKPIVPVPKPAAAPPAAPATLAPDINDAALRAARGAPVKEFPPTKTSVPQTKQVTQATEAGQALKEANNITLTLDERIQAISAIKATEEDFVTLAADQIRDKYNTLLRDGVNSILKTVNKITDAATKRKYQTKLSKSYLGKLEQIDSQTFVRGSQKGIGREKMARLRARAKAMEQRLPEGQYGAEVELKLEQLRAAGVEVDELMIMKLQSGTSVDELLAEIGRL